MGNQHQPTLSYSVIPCTQDQVPHAVWDFVLLALHLGGGRAVALRAVCGHEVVPGNRLPPGGARLCPACRAKLPSLAVARPAPGQPMLNDLARIITGP